MISQPSVRRRRLARVATAGLVVAICAACGLSNTAKSTISQGASTAGSGTVSRTSSGGGTTTAQTQTQAQSGDGTTAVDPNAVDPNAATDPNAPAAGSTPAAGDPSSVAQGNNLSTDTTVPNGSNPVVPVAGSTPGSGSNTAPAVAGKTTAPAVAGKTTAPTGGKTTAPTGSKTTAPTGSKTTAPNSSGKSTGTATAPGPTATTAPAATAATCNTAGGDATGVTDTDINIGLHAPLTGTGTPFNNSSFDEGSKIFWKQTDASGKIAHQVCGRNVQLDFEDDTYTPTGANKVCSAFATTKFLVLGGAGTDQIQACATNTDMDSNNVPYLSAGVTTNGLTGLANYFAVSLTYAQQGTVLVKAAQQNGFLKPAASTDGKQWAIVTGSSGNFTDAQMGMTQALDAAGVSYTVFPVDQSSGNYQAAATQLGTTLALKGYKTIYTLTAPGYWLYITNGYYKQSPTGNGVAWTGPGVSFTDFIVAQLVCSGSANAINGAAYYLAPNTGLDKATPDFLAAAKADGQPGDDIQWGLYGLDQGVYALLTNAAQTGLTRQNFIASVPTQAVNVNGAYAPLSFNGASNHHLGGTGAYLQKIDCGKSEPGQTQTGTWDTVGTNYLTP